MMKKVFMLNVIIFLVTCLTGCGQNKIEVLSANTKKIELTGNLVTYQAYYHNVIEHDKPVEDGILHWFEKDRKLFAEYTGTIKLGINLSKVKIDVKGNEINVFIPKAEVIGEPNIDKDDFDAKNFIESADGLNPNPINANDSTEAFYKAQQKMKENAENDEALLEIAQKRAEAYIEENIKQFSGLTEKDYIIIWDCEK